LQLAAPWLQRDCCCISIPWFLTQKGDTKAESGAGPVARAPSPAKALQEARPGRFEGGRVKDVLS